MRATSPFLFLPYSGICALRWEVAVWYFCAQNQVRTTDNRLHDVCRAIMKILRDGGALCQLTRGAYECRESRRVDAAAGGGEERREAGGDRCPSPDALPASSCQHYTVLTLSMSTV